MAEDEVRDLVSSVAQRGAALGVSTLPEEIRHNFSRSRHPDGHRIPTASVFRRRISVVVVAALILAVFFLPLPHVSLFRHLVTPAGPSTTASVPPTVPNTSSTGPRTIGPRLAGVDGAAAWALSATRLSVSDDGGLDWSDLALPGGVSPGAVASIAEASNGELWLATVKGASTVKLYRRETSTSAGWSYTTLVPVWSTAAAGWPFQANSVMITPGPGDMVTVVVSDGLTHSAAIPRLFVSLDEGATFQQYPMPVTSALNTYWQSVTFITPEWGVLVVSYGAGAGEAVFHTSDGGASWSSARVAGISAGSKVQFGTPFVEGPAIEIPVVASASNGGETFALYVSHDDGARFAGPIGSVISADSFGPGPSPLAVYGQTLWLVGEGKIYESESDGQTWRTVTSSDLPPITAMSLTSPTAATAVAGISSCARVETGCTTRTYFVRTTDAGKTWSALSDVPTTIRTVFEPTGVAFWTADEGLLVGTMETAACSSNPMSCRGMIERTVDGGRSWQVVDRTSWAAADVAVVGSTVAWVSLQSCGKLECSATHFLVTADGGRQWRAVASRAQLGSLSPISAESAWAVRVGSNGPFDDSFVFTSNQGRTWQARADPCSLEKMGHPEAISFATPTLGWAACMWDMAGQMSAKALFETMNAGSTWKLQAETCPTGVSHGNEPGALLCAGYSPGLRMLPDGYGWLWSETGTLQSTSDGGRQWRAIGTKVVVSMDLNCPLAAWVVSDRIGELLVDNVGLYDTTSGGASWHLIRSWPVLHRAGL
jgi:photosystem II stability/assembly factor-like uncharacterized protein